MGRVRVNGETGKKRAREVWQSPRSAQCRLRYLPGHPDGHRLVESDSKAGIRRHVNLIAAREEEGVTEYGAAADGKCRSQRYRAGKLRFGEGECPQAEKAPGEALPGD